MAEAKGSTSVPPETGAETLVIPDGWKLVFTSDNHRMLVPEQDVDLVIGRPVLLATEAYNISECEADWLAAMKALEGSWTGVVLECNELGWARDVSFDAAQTATNLFMAASQKLSQAIHMNYPTESVVHSIAAYKLEHGSFEGLNRYPAGYLEAAERLLKSHKSAVQKYVDQADIDRQNGTHESGKFGTQDKQHAKNLELSRLPEDEKPAT